MNSNIVKRELRLYSDKTRKEFLPKFFKTGIGEYGYGDKFIGVTVPNCRVVAKKYKDLGLPEVLKLLNSIVHEERLTSLLILVDQFEKGDDKTRTRIFNFYIRHKSQVNNWDLVDLSAPKIVGQHLTYKPRNLLYKLAESKSIWDRRISIISTYTFIRSDDFKDTLEISTILLRDNHDLIHKAVGWMLREVGKKDKLLLDEYLIKYYQKMPRTMLRYAIEKYPQIERENYLKGTI